MPKLHSLVGHLVNYIATLDEVYKVSCYSIMIKSSLTFARTSLKLYCPTIYTCNYIVHIDSNEQDHMFTLSKLNIWNLGIVSYEFLKVVEFPSLNYSNCSTISHCSCYYGNVV